MSLNENTGIKGALKISRATILLWDVICWVIAAIVIFSLTGNSDGSSSWYTGAALIVALSIIVQLLFGYVSRVYLGRHRLGSFRDAGSLAILVGVGPLPVGVLAALFSDAYSLAESFLIPLLALFFMEAGRWIIRVFEQKSRKTLMESGVSTLVYGAGEAGHQVAKLVDNSESAPYQIVGFLDDEPSKKYLRVSGYRVLGTGKDLETQVNRTGATTVILAISEPSRELVNDLEERCDKLGVNLIVIPSVTEMIGGRVTLEGLRSLNLIDLLGRREIKTDLSEVSSYINGKVVLVTGAGGSIGSELSRQLANLGPSKLVLLDHDETHLHSTVLSIYGNGLLEKDGTVLADIREPDVLEKLFMDLKPDVVFHTAALKHLPMLERFPEEGWKTNVLGSLNVLQAAHKAGVSHLVNISTDKAADASSVLGKTKRLAEQLTAWFADTYSLRYVSVRFGNVLGSRGSVLYTFKNQIESGKPITITHPDVSRYFMTIPEACQLVIEAGSIGKAGNVMVLDMGQPVKILNIAKRLIKEAGSNNEIVFTGLRPGEKVSEVLFSNFESGEPTSHELISQVGVPPIAPDSIGEIKESIISTKD